MKRTAILLLVMVLSSCTKDDPTVFFEETDLLGLWELKSVDLIQLDETTSLTPKITACPEIERLIITSLDNVVWVSYFPWVDEPTAFCNERAEAMNFRLVENQLLVDEFNQEAIISGKLISYNTLNIYRYYRNNKTAKLKYVFNKS